VIIIGAGIGGLVCGNYLAKAGRKVLILEKNNFAGGCCSSFISDGFFFDSGPHLLNELGIKGSFREVLEELKIYKEKDYIRLDPLAVFYFGREKYVFKSGYKECLCYLKSKFSSEDVDGFFSLMNKGYIYLYNKLRNDTFQDILDKYFNDPVIKALFYSFVSALGTLPERLSGIYALKFLESVFIYGGFYPSGGMQSISDRLVTNLSKNNGEIILSNPVKEILVKKRKAYGVLSSNNKKFFADIIVSNIRPINTFKELIKSIKLPNLIRKRMYQMELTESAFLVHIALKDKIDIFRKKTLYLIISSNTKRDREKNKKLYSLKSLSYKPLGFICMPTSIFQTRKRLRQNNSLILMAIMYYKPKSFWTRYKEKFANAMIDDIENLFPGFKNNILFKKVTTPASLEFYTGSNKGAVGGWAMTPQQIGYKSFPYQGLIENLYFTGHWTYPGVGISSVATSGRNVARLILRY
jgi:prolycopene isomerase